VLDPAIFAVNERLSANNRLAHAFQLWQARSPFILVLAVLYGKLLCELDNVDSSRGHNGERLIGRVIVTAAWQR
jgi:hypothetical protein